MKKVRTLILGWLILVWYAEIANAYGVSAKGTINGKVLNLSSISNYELVMNISESASGGSGSLSPEIVQFKVDGRDLAKPEYRALAMRLGMPIPFINAVRQIDVNELKSRKKVSREVYGGLRVDLVYRDETTKDVTVDMSGDGVDATEVVMPRPWLTGQLVVLMEARHRIRGNLTYDLNGVLQGGKVTWEILVEPTSPKAPEKKEEKPKEGPEGEKGSSEAREPEKPSEPRKPPEAPEPPPGTGPRIPDEPRAFRMDFAGWWDDGKDPGTVGQFRGYGRKGSPERWSGGAMKGDRRGGGEPEPSPPAPSSPEPSPPPEPPRAPVAPEPPPQPSRTLPSPAKEPKGADLKTLAKFGFSYSLKVDFEIQMEPVKKEVQGSPSEK
ncbi:MAG: hypothetical protein V2G42_03725 [bacterium JZ-2024 1]